MQGDRSFFAPFALAGALAVGLALWSFQLLKERNRTAADLKQAEAQLALQAQLTGEKEAEIVALTRRQNQQLATVEERFRSEIDDLKARQAQRLSQAYAQFNAIVGQENNESLAYIGQLETRLRKGLEVTDAELEKLASIGSGLAVLQQQYQRPIGEFKALESYLADKASAQPDAPDMRFAALKRVFSKRFRNEVNNYQQDLGKQQAFEEAYAQYSQAYDRAQAGMEALGDDLRSQTASLYDLIGQKKADAADLAEFFATSRRALGIHQDLLDFEPVVEVPATPAP